MLSREQSWCTSVRGQALDSTHYASDAADVMLISPVGFGWGQRSPTAVRRIRPGPTFKRDGLLGPVRSAVGHRRIAPSTCRLADDLMPRRPQRHRVNRHQRRARLVYGSCDGPAVDSSQGGVEGKTME